MRSADVPDAVLVEAAMRNGGVLTLPRLGEAGMSRHTITKAVADGRLRRLRHNAYIPKRIWDTATGDARRMHMLETAAALASMYSADAVVSHDSAAVLQGMSVLDRPSEVMITRPPGKPGTSADGIKVRSAALPANHVCRVFGVPVTSPARTVIDVSRSHDFPAGLVVTDSALIDCGFVRSTCGRW
jgi:predicted transcriptional regulator of viral defense system